MQYEIIRSGRKTVAIQVKDGKIIVRAPLRATLAEIDKIVCDNSAWIEKQMIKAQERDQNHRGLVPLSTEELKQLADRALEVIPPRVKYYAEKIGVTYGRITIRNQRSRWGSCSSKGNLNFNCLLMLAPPEVLDSVIVHELCHRKQMNHSAQFYAEIERVFPEYRKWHDWLKQHGESLMWRMINK
jgi:predicted metal-dependent hydrolase